MIDGLVVRKYQHPDRGSCRRLWRELVEWHRQIYHDPTIGDEHPEDCFDKHLARFGADRIWVAVINGVVVGFTSLVPKGAGGGDRAHSC